jgi:hypothetical protein
MQFEREERKEILDLENKIKEKGAIRKINQLVLNNLTKELNSLKQELTQQREWIEVIVNITEGGDSSANDNPNNHNRSTSNINEGGLELH